MAIPNIIFQTYKSDKLPWITKWHIKKMRRINSDYDYQFYDDARIDQFIQNEFDAEVYSLYKKIKFGAAKADFFRYAILFKYGGVYVDIDSLITKKLSDFILPTDQAIISLESNLKYYVQWALVYEAGHPFLKKTLDLVIDNLRENRFPHSVHDMTGPAAYSTAINLCLKESNLTNYRQLGTDYDGNFKFHYPMSKFFLYGLTRKNHWKKQQVNEEVLFK
jgi:mannosyltransferase OCH1-like enzyme